MLIRSLILDMAVIFKNVITPSKSTTIYGHNGLNAGGNPASPGNFSVETLMDLLQIKQNGLDVSFLFDGKQIGAMTIPSDRYLKSATFDANTNILTLVFITETGEQSIEVDMSALGNVYTSGNGLNLSSGGEFSIKLAPKETRLKLDVNGLSLDLSDIAQELEAHKTALMPHSYGGVSYGLSFDAEGNVIFNYKENV